MLGCGPRFSAGLVFGTKDTQAGFIPWETSREPTRHPTPRLVDQAPPAPSIPAKLSSNRRGPLRRGRMYARRGVRRAVTLLCVAPMPVCALSTPQIIKGIKMLKKDVHNNKKGCSHVSVQNAFILCERVCRFYCLCTGHDVC
jgi:hypothetical protein